ncbi:MAG: tetraacyldisaccharide 4'-kinase [Bacteroidetes bacterium]|nr:tetraacyldisaccharide 4'-kinase [Bacteroidota bacterium]MBS1756769.1 tetraacyldisaccharide 4'-kinase [Bacteroidota bacterium]
MYHWIIALHPTIFIHFKTNILLKSFRYLLLPFSLLYGAAVWLRNWLYDINILKSSAFNFPIICIGNLAVGGTGKTPMTEYLVELLDGKYITATLSRGYKRKTKGFAIAGPGTTAIEIGDEPMQFHQKYPNLTVAVGEERLVAIPQLLHEKPMTQVIILDDAFQHRSVRAGLNILLTEYKNLYTRDIMLPSGDLRDIKKSSKRADIIIVTKCKAALTDEEKNNIIKEINPLLHQEIFFTEIIYTQPYHLFNKSTINFSADTDCLLLCGIANPKPLKEFLTAHVHSYDMLRFPDHHIFSSDDLTDIKTQFEKLESQHKIIVTTEKDAVRLQKFEKEISDYPIYVMPIRHQFLFSQGNIFNQKILAYINSSKPLTIN